MSTHLGFDVLEIEPNRPGPLTEGITRAHEVLDSQTGERWTDPLEAAAVGDRPFRWPCFSRADARAQRAWLDARKGLVVPFWAPTWERDLTLAADGTHGSATLTIQRVEYAGLLWPGSNGRRHIAVYVPGAAPSYHYVSLANYPRSGETEQLTIVPVLPVDCPAATTRISFLRFCRLGNPFDERAWSGGAFCAAEIPFVEIPKEAPSGSYSLGFIADPHIGVTINEAHVQTCLAWMLGHATGLAGILAMGDLIESPDHAFNTWLRDPAGGNVPESIPLLPVPGNWDAEIPWGGPHDVTPEQPHATLLSRYPGFFNGCEWYSWDHDTLRVLATNNNTDYMADAGYAAYYNDNPPGHWEELNPDHGGISVPGSAQRTWLDARCASNHPWKIIAGHRSLWAPYDSDPRKLNRLARPAMATPIDRGVSLIVTGDIHVGSFSGPWYPTPPDCEEYRSPGSVGAYSLTLAGSYFPRNSNPAVLPDPETTLHWCSPSEGVVGSGLCHAAILTIQGDTAYLEIFACDNADPTGAIVYTHTLVRNPGLPA